MAEDSAQAGRPALPLLAQPLRFPQTVDGGTICRCMEEATFFLVRSGTAEVQACGESVLLTAGDALFLNAGCPHAVWAASPCETAFFTFPAQLVCGAAEGALAVQYAAPLLSDEAFPFFVLSSVRHAQTVTLLENILELEQAQPEGFELLVKGIACAVWAQLWAARLGVLRGGNAPRAPRGMVRLRQAVAYIHSHYAEKLSLDTIAQACSISRSECCRMFQRALRQTPFDYLLRYRVYCSLPLVLGGSLSITEIAWITGFSGASYFSEIFRRYYGCSPTEYRKTCSFAPQEA